MPRSLSRARILTTAARLPDRIVENLTPLQRPYSGPTSDAASERPLVGLALREVAAKAGWQVVEEFIDHGISGSKGRSGRPALDRMLKGATRREYDMVAAWSVDRLGRSLQDLVALLGDLQGAGVDLYLHQQALDTSTPAGRALFQMLGVFSEFERALIVERVRAGVRRAQKHGTKSGKAIGRPRVEVATEVAIRTLRRQGRSIGAIAAEVGCGRSVVQRVLAAAA